MGLETLGAAKYHPFKLTKCEFVLLIYRLNVTDARHLPPRSNGNIFQSAAQGTSRLDRVDIVDSQTA